MRKEMPNETAQNSKASSKTITQMEKQAPEKVTVEQGAQKKKMHKKKE